MSITADFLRHVLPDDGYYAAFVLRTKRHVWTRQIDELAEWILQLDAQGETVYHACASYNDQSRRKQDNAYAAKSLWLDIDLAPKSRYPDVYGAALAVEKFAAEAVLPCPLYVASGHGLHAYWPLDQALDAERWAAYARGLKSACNRFGLDAGPERTADIASILRTPGTHNRKRDQEVEVQCGPLVGPYPIEAFRRLLDGLPDRRPALSERTNKRSLAANLGATYEDEPRYAERIAEQCAALGNFRANEGRLPEPLWYAGLGVMAYCADGESCAHEWSSGYGGYTEEETNERLARARKLSGATTCEKFHSLDPKTCGACPHWGKIRSPISLGKSRGDQRGTESPQVGTATPFNPFGEAIKTEDVSDLPQLPHDFYWSDQRALIVKSEGNKGGGVDVVVSNFPIYLASVQTGEVRGEWTFILRQFIPERGWFDIPIAASVLFGSQSSSELASRGANVHEHGHFIRYVRAAIDLHYRSSKLTVRYDQFGWKDQDRAFLYGLDLYMATGVERVVGNDELQVRCKEDWVGPCTGGDLDGWKQAINSLFALGCEPQSVALLASFAAPLMRFQERDEGGAIIHLVTRESGTGKSTALIGAASVWGRREGLGLTNDDTRVSKALTLGALGNLPVVYDEMTVRDPEAIRQFVINFTNGRDKMRATRNGEIRHTASTWQTLMISAANSSLVDILSASNMPEAPAFRIMEFALEVPDGVRHVQGDTLRKKLRANSGHAGAVYIAWVIANIDWVKKTLEAVTQQTWARTGLKSEHRFWVRTIAAIAVAGVIVKKLGLVEFSVERIMTWLFENLGDARGGLTSTWATDTIAEFLNANRDSTLVVARAYVHGERQLPVMEPKWKLSIRYEQNSGRYIIAQSALREYVMQKEQSYSEMVRVLEAKGVVTRKRIQSTLGAGTSIPGGQVWCIEVQGSHPLLGGIVPLAENVVPLARGLGR